MDLTKNAFSDTYPRWSDDGNIITFLSDRNAARMYGGNWSFDKDIYAIFLNKVAYDKFKTESSKKIKSVGYDFDNVKKRTEKLSNRASNFIDAIMINDKDLAYIKFAKCAELIIKNLETGKEKVIKLAQAANIIGYDKDNIFLAGRKEFLKVNIASCAIDIIPVDVTTQINAEKEREYLFNHIINQIEQNAFMKFDSFATYAEKYRKFLPFINNKVDFSEMVSELLGELNISHTGCGFDNEKGLNSDKTAQLAIFIDYDFDGSGIKIKDIIEESPLSYGKDVKGYIISKIDDKEIRGVFDYYSALNHKIGKEIVIELRDVQGKIFIKKVKGISLRDEQDLLYEKWIANNAKVVDEQSNGKVGYCHLRTMHDRDFRKIYSKLLGEYQDKEKVIIDIRYNTGGWLHSELLDFLRGVQIAKFSRRGKVCGMEQRNSWTKKSILLVNESNYSDGYVFPYLYQKMKLGQVIGTEIPGSPTSVHWENLRDNYYMGIPISTMVDDNGKVLDGVDFVPDVIIKNQINDSKDYQLEHAIKNFKQ